MADHLSELDLDELEVGTARPAAQSHLAGCPECRERQSARHALAEQIAARPGFRHTLTRVAAEQASRSRRRPLRWFALVPAAVLAGLLVVLLPAREPAPADRLKGTAQLELVLEDGRRVDGPLTPGTRVALRAGGADYLLVAAVDARGEVAQVWPTSGPSGAVARNRVATLEPTLQVTPGDFTLVALFSSAPVTSEALREAREARRDGGPGQVVEIPVRVASP